MSSATKLEWFRTDSGHPGVDDYTTVILIHGMNWHEACFHPMYPFAAPAGLRFIALNRRGYPGTTPYTPYEMALLTSDDPKSRDLFHRQEGLAITRAVLEILADPVLAIPETSKVGILGLSTGNWHVLAILNSIDHPDLSSDERSKLKARLSHAILLEPATNHMGGDVPSNAFFPTVTAEDPMAVSRWASGYFDHPDLASRDASRLNFKDFLSDPSPVTDRISPEDIAKLSLDARPTDGPLLTPAWHSTNKRATKEALKKVKDGLWPHVKRISVIWGDRTFWLIPPAIWALEDHAAELGGPELDIRLNKGHNHFSVFDYAKETTGFVKEIMAT